MSKVNEKEKIIVIKRWRKMNIFKGSHEKIFIYLNLRFGLIS